MKISRLHTFVRLADLKSFSLVAEELQLTQPAVSIQVKSLEEHFGVQLVERSSDGITLTMEGELLYKDAREILHIWENIGQKMNQLQSVVKGQLTIGASTIPAEYLLPEMVVHFCLTYPLVELKMEVGDSSSVIQDLVKRKYDVGIVGYQPEEEDIVAIPIAADQLVLVAPNQHPLKSRGKVAGRDILQERFILREEGSGTRKTMREGLAQIGLRVRDLQTVAQMGSTEAVIAAVEAGLGLAIVSSLAARRAEKLQRLKVIELEGFHIERKFYLSYLAEQKGQPLLEKFIEYLQNNTQLQTGE